MTGGANTLGTSVDSLDFVLMRAKVGGADVPNPVGTAGTRAAAGVVSTSDAGIGELYRLDGETEMRNPHVGHHVAIVGTRGGATSPDDIRSNAAAPSLATAPLVRVESVKMIAETCHR